MQEVSEHVAAEAVTIRKAVENDLPDIRRIYNYYVLNSTATFDTEEQTEDQRRRWWDDHVSNGLPVLVAECDGKVTGWASWSFYHTRCAYRQTVEPSLYIAHEYLGRGLGRRLMEALMAAAREGGFHTAVVLICSENVASLKLVRESGFELVGTLKEVGRKHNRWLDVTIFQRSL
jgi:phosphinothricin acetyltransferase